MEDEVAIASQQSHLSYCSACQYMIMNHSMNGNLKQTLKLMSKEIKVWERKEKKEFRG